MQLVLCYRSRAAVTHVATQGTYTGRLLVYSWDWLSASLLDMSVTPAVRNPPRNSSPEIRVETTVPSSQLLSDAVSDPAVIPSSALLEHPVINCRRLWLRPSHRRGFPACYFPAQLAYLCIEELLNLPPAMKSTKRRPTLRRYATGRLAVRSHRGMTATNLNSQAREPPGTAGISCPPGEC